MKCSASATAFTSNVSGRLVMLIVLLTAPFATAAVDGDREAVVAYGREVYVERLLAAHPELSRVELTLIGQPVFPAGSVVDRSRPVEMDASPGTSARAGIRVPVVAAGGRARVLRLWFKVAAFRQVMVSLATVRVGELVPPTMVTMAERDVAGLRGEPWASPPTADTPPWRARRHLVTGSILTDADIEIAPPVRRAQAVRVRVVAGPIVIETTGVAEQDGRLGERITVREPGGRESYAATVASAGTVNVEAR